jgi:DNA-binding CsgD family transcriptional regulator
MGAGVAASADLIRLAYEGVLRKEAWGEMLALACRAFGAKDVYFARIPVNPPGPRMVLTHGVDPKITEAYREAWVAPPKNPTLTPLLPERYRGILEREEVIRNSEFERSEFYQVCRRPRGVDAELGGGEVGIGGWIRFLAVNRARGDPPFGEFERRLMTLLYPHLMQALAIDAALAAERSGAAWMGCAVDSLDDPAIRRDPDGRLHPLNTAGQEFLRVEGFGAWDGEGVLPRDPRPSLRCGGPTSPAGGVGVERTFRSGRVWRVFAAPCFEGDRFVGEVYRLRIVRASRSHPALEAQPLTPHEHDVAALLCEGLSTPEICERLGIRRNTLNTHFRHLFEKTGCHSRAQLVVHLALAPLEPEAALEVVAAGPSESVRYRD